MSVYSQLLKYKHTTDSPRSGADLMERIAMVGLGAVSRSVSGVQ